MLESIVFEATTRAPQNDIYTELVLAGQTKISSETLPFYSAGTTIFALAFTIKIQPR